MTTVTKVRKIRRRTLVRLNPGSGEPDVAEVGSAGSRVAVWASRWFPQVAQKREASSLRWPHLVQYTRAPSRAALAPLERQAETETDEDSARQPLEGTTDPGPPQHIARLGHGHGIGAQPAQGHRAEEEAEEEEGGERRPAPGRELRQEAREEARHLGIPEIADHPLPEGRPGAKALHRHAGRRRAIGPAGAPGHPQRLAAEEDQIGGPRQLDHSEGRLRGDHEGRDARAGRERPNGLARGYPESGEHTALPPAHQTVPHRQGRVRPRRDDDENGDADERDELAHAVGDLTGSVASPRGRRAPWSGAPCPGQGRRSSSSTSPGPRPCRA